MKNDGDGLSDAGEMRRRAEEIFRKKAAGNAEGRALSSDEMQQALHELRVHQIELEMQNEELRRTQEELVAARSRYFDLYELAPVGYFTLSEKGMILEANLAACFILGVVRITLFTQPISRFILKDDQDSFYLYRKQVFGPEKSKVCELRMVRGDGTLFWARLEASSGKDADGAPVILVVLTDICERKQLEEKLLKLSQLDESILASISDSFFSLDENLVVTYFNPAAEKALGRKRKDVIGRKLFDAFPEARGSIFEESYTRALKEKITISFETCFDVAPFENWYAVRVYPFADGISVFFQIITERKRTEDALRRQNDLVGELLKNLQIGVYLMDARTGKPLLANEASFRLLGRGILPDAEAETISKVYDLYKSGSNEPYPNEELPLVVALKGESKHVDDMVVVHPDGTRINLEVFGSPVKDAEGHIWAGIVTFQDITARKLAEEQLRISRERLLLATEGANLGVWNWDLLTDELVWSDKCKALFGIPSDESVSMQRFREVLHPDDRERMGDSVKKALRDHEDYDVEYRSIWPDGSIHWLLARGRGYYDETDQALRMEGIVMDISERKMMEALLSQSQELYRELVEGTDDLVTIVDGRGLFTYVNHSAEKVYGVKVEDCAGQSAFDFVHPEDRDRTKRAFEGWVRDKASHAVFQNRQVSKSGHVFDMLWNVYLHFTDSGEVEKIRSYARDITEIKKAEDLMTTLNAELEARVNRRTSELTAAIKELESFSYSVSHDLKAPLRAMAGFANILAEDYGPKLDANGRRVIGVINDNARIMGQLIDDLLRLSRMGRQEMELVELDVTALVRSVDLELRKTSYPDRAIEVSVKPLPSARADTTLAHQIVLNLLSNAMKFTGRKEKAVIEIGSYDKDGEGVYYVKDNGAGFDMKYVDKLFRVFQRLHKPEEFSGTGVGLAIVRSAVQRHGGRVWAEGAVDQGATFYFTLPKGG